MQQLKRSLQFYIYGMVAASAVGLAAVAAVDGVSRSTHAILLVVLLASFSALAHLAPVKYAAKRSLVLHISLQAVAILTLPPAEAALAIGLGVLVGNMYLRRPWFNCLFNAAQVCLAVQAGALVYRALTPVSLAEAGASYRSVLAFVPAIVLNYLVTTLAVDGITAIQRRRSPFRGWFESHGPGIAAHLVLIVVGAACAGAIAARPWLMLLALVPAVAVRTLVREAVGFDAEILAIAEETADLVEECRPALAGRSRRVADLARDLSRACGLSEEDARRAYLAARLHDLTAALMPEHASLEAEILDEEQRHYRRAHAEEAALWVRDVLRLHGVAEAMRFHHERFDGRGYPYGLAGADIPVDSRILAVCEAWANLTSELSYRPAFTEQQALLVMHAGAGTQWDPDIVHALRDLVQGAPAPSEAPVRAVPVRQPMAA